MCKQTMALIMAGMLLAGGCGMTCPLQQVENAPVELENQPPVAIDQAMQLRQWQQSTALYGNGNVVAGPTGFPYIPRWGQAEPLYVVEETPLFIGQSVASPFVFVFTPPWTPELYTGVTLEPTFTALPPIPGRSEMEPAPTTQP